MAILFIGRINYLSSKHLKMTLCAKNNSLLQIIHTIKSLPNSIGRFALNSSPKYEF